MSDLVRCPVCDGKGWWNALTGELIPYKLAFTRVRLFRCLFCRGDGKVILSPDVMK